jgi:S1-C subfamily serine protease
MKMWINNLPRLAALVIFGVVTSGSVNAGENLELDEERRAELEASLDEAREQLDEAAARLGELHGQLYKMETLGSHGKKPMLGVLLGDRSESGGLEVVGVTPGGGAEEAGMETGDDLISVNDVDLTTADSAMNALREAMQEVAPGDSVPVGYQRDGSVQIANVTTKARGFFIMGMTGAPDVDFEIEGLEALEALTEGLADIDFSSSMDWTDELVERLEMLEEVSPHVRHGIQQAVKVHSGLRLEEVTSDLAQYFGVDQGVLVLAVPDDLQQLKGGDVILAVAGEEVARVRDAYQALHRSEEVVSVEILRQGVRETVDVDPGDLTADRRVIMLHRDEEGATFIAPPDPP